MFFRLIEYLKFLLGSTNQHGVHSPFVYNYVTKCLYAKKKCHASKTMNVTLKSITYFKIKSLALPSNKKEIKELIIKEFPGLQFDECPSDMILINIADFEKEYSAIATVIHNNTILYIEDIHRNPSDNKLWETIKNKDEVTVTVDLFYCGLVFFRKEQAKEHFKIRT